MEARVVKLVSEATKIDADKISAGTSFIDDLNLDSLDIVELMMKMEEEFKVEIPEGDAEKLKTVGDVVRYLQSR